MFRNAWDPRGVPARRSLRAVTLGTRAIALVWSQVVNRRRQRGSYLQELTMRALIVLVACYPFVATAETLNVKTGVWEITSTSTLSGAPGLPPELLEQLSDEQRAEVEKRLKDASDRAYTDVSRECVTELDLRNPFESANPDECTQ